MQKTIKRPIHVQGVGLHSGKLVKMRALPAPAGSGIIFKRIDLEIPILIPVKVDAIEEALLCTRLSSQASQASQGSAQEGRVSVSTIEHLLSALCALEIDNILFEIDADEVPIMDGSASSYIFLLQSAGITEQEENRRFLKIKNTIRIEDPQDKNKYAEFSPTQKGLEIQYSIDFEHPIISSTAQSIHIYFQPTTYIKEISRARTFGFIKDLEMLQANNLARGASLENAIGLTDDAVMNPEGLRYQDEFVRHKLLDAIGDLYVAGPILGKFTGHKTSHTLNNQLLRKLLSSPDNYEWVS